MAAMVKCKPKFPFATINLEDGLPVYLSMSQFPTEQEALDWADRQRHYGKRCLVVKQLQDSKEA